MENKPLHYDGSVPLHGDHEVEGEVVVTDEMRKNLFGNPYTHSVEE